MLLRKVQEMGGATLLVSLPKQWANSSNIKKGSLVAIEPSADGGLMIYPTRDVDDEKIEKELEIKYPSKFNNEGLPNEITAAYLLGFDLIRIKGQYRIAPKDRERIISSIKSLIGLEVVEEDAYSISSQFLVDNRAVEPSRIFKRISVLVRSMILDSIKQFASAESEQATSVAQRDDEVDRLHFLLVRMLRTAVREPRVASAFGLSAIECLDYRVATNSLETAGDYAVELADSLSKLGSMDGKNLDLMLKIGNFLDSMQDSATRSFTKKDFKLAQIVFNSYSTLEGQLKGLRNVPDESLASILHFSDIIERIARCHRDIADLVSPVGEDQTVNRMN